MDDDTRSTLLKQMKDVLHERNGLYAAAKQLIIIQNKLLASKMSISVEVEQLLVERSALLKKFEEHDKGREQSIEPIPMLLWCPKCNERHVDTGEFATKPHHTHACQSCGMVWRPAVVNTVGVRFLPGFKDEGVPIEMIF